jgi:hypothetical protein
LQDLNVRLIGVHGSSFDFANGSLCITNIGSRSNLPGSPGSWVDPPGGPGLAGFLYLPIFLLILDRSSHRVDRFLDQASLGLITMFNIAGGLFGYKK